MLRVRVEAPVHPTESDAKVKLACLNLFPDLAFAEEGDVLVGEGTDVGHFRELLRIQRIRDTARDVLIRGRRETVVRFALNKQAAYVGRVNFTTGSPLGDLHVTLEAEDTDALIDHVAESTVGDRLTGTRGRTGGT
ncbi:MAG: RNA-binding domain-containing protein [Candidatus Thermoplasmatota archaeon]